MKTVKTEKSTHYVFNRFKRGDLPDTFVSPMNNLDDALFEFVFQTLGYSIIEIENYPNTQEIKAKEV